jgi:predicted small metal-binding protein
MSRSVRFGDLPVKIVKKSQARQSPGKGHPMASQVICECGYVMRDDDEDRVVALVRDHIRADHPDLLDMATPEMVRTWIEITP